ncbi:MAG: hypothetical protein ACLQLC_16435 [Candidatus Sulfotelmatobacter sp.]
MPRPFRSCYDPNAAAEERHWTMAEAAIASWAFPPPKQYEVHYIRPNPEQHAAEMTPPAPTGE